MRYSIEEQERNAYQAGDTTRASLLAELIDAQELVQKQETELDDRATLHDYATLEQERDKLEQELQTARAQLDDLYDAIHDAKRLNKASILKQLAEVLK